MAVTPRGDVYRRAFERSLWEPLLVQAFGAGAAREKAAEGLQEAQAAAWDAWNLELALKLALTLRAQGRLPWKAGYRLRRALLQLGMFAIALDLVDGSPRSDRDFAWGVDRAWALAGLGRLDEAMTQLLTVGRSDAGQSTDYADLGRVLKGVAGLGDAKAWRDVREPLVASLRLGLADLAAVLAATGFRRGAPRDEAELNEALELVYALFRVCGPRPVADLLDAMGPLWATAEDHAAFASVRKVLAGGLDDGVMMDADAANLTRSNLRYVLALACAAGGATQSAIRRLGRISARNRTEGEQRYDLARLVGEEVLKGSRLEFVAPGPRRRVFDVFPFNGEFMLLDIKLNQMRDWVDSFVIVEARRTFTGRPKPLHFAEAQDRFAAFADKIVHVVVDDFPDYADAAWSREFFQRDSAVRGLCGRCAPDDLIILSDVDELVDRQAVDAFPGSYAACAVRTFAYFLNLLRTGESKQELKPALFEARFLAHTGASYARTGLWAYSKRVIPNGGWHFSWMLDGAGIVDKATSYSHEEWAEPALSADFDAIRRSIRQGAPVARFTRVDLDDSFPDYIWRNRRALADFIL